jgi:hypothetical protein
MHYIVFQHDGILALWKEAREEGGLLRKAK